MHKTEIQSNIATIQVVKAAPSKNIIPKEVYQQFNFRKYSTWEGENSVTIIDMQEPVWWNRPLKANTEEALSVASDGIYQCMLPLFKETSQLWKTNYNVLVNKNNLPTLIQLKFENPLSTQQLQQLLSMSFWVILQTLIKLGVPETDLCCLNNDLLIKGKKFAGSERIYRDNIYTECLFINLKYEDEKELFSQIYQGKKPHRLITGILDEYPNLTKETFIEAYCTEFKTNLDQFATI